MYAQKVKIKWTGPDIVYTKSKNKVDRPRYRITVWAKNGRMN